MWNCHLQLPFRVHLWGEIWPHNTEQELQSYVRSFVVPSPCTAEPPILLCWLLCPGAGDKQNLPQTEYWRLKSALWCSAAKGVKKTWEIFILMYKTNVPHLLPIFLSNRLQQSKQPLSRWTCFAEQNIGIREVCSISVMPFDMCLWVLSVFGLVFVSKVKCLRSVTWKMRIPGQSLQTFCDSLRISVPCWFVCVL